MSVAPVTMTQVKMFFGLPHPSTIFATDTVDPEKYTNRGNAGPELVQEVCAKVIENLKNGTDVKLLIEDDTFIVRDSAFALPEVGEHLEAARNAMDSVHEALDRLESAATPLKGVAKRLAAGTKSRHEVVSRKKTSGANKNRNRKRN